MSKSENSRTGVLILTDSYEYHFANNALYRDSERITLTRKESRLFDLLVNAFGGTVLLETIDYELWPECSVKPSTRRTLIYRLRKKLPGLDIKVTPGHGCWLEAAE